MASRWQFLVLLSSIRPKGDEDIRNHRLEGSLPSTFIGITGQIRITERIHEGNSMFLDIKTLPLFGLDVNVTPRRDGFGSSTKSRDRNDTRNCHHIAYRCSAAAQNMQGLLLIRQPLSESPHITYIHTVRHKPKTRVRPLLPSRYEGPLTGDAPRTVQIQKLLVLESALPLGSLATRGRNVNVLGADIIARLAHINVSSCSNHQISIRDTHLFRAADQRPNNRVKLRRRGPEEVLEGHIRQCDQ